MKKMALTRILLTLTILLLFLLCIATDSIRLVVLCGILLTSFAHANGRSLYIVDMRMMVVEGGKCRTP